MSKGTRMNLPSDYVLALDCSEFMDDEKEFALNAATAHVIPTPASKMA
jgi:hypothetical protein